ncbi:MAG: hypothetical protein H7Z11_14635 [Verrucomicrobia bacterium]|nr:hypothetical protein [Leptolyngbya sp. ES-bin-22]
MHHHGCRLTRAIKCLAVEGRSFVTAVPLVKATVWIEVRPSVGRSDQAIAFALLLRLAMNPVSSAKAQGHQGFTWGRVRPSRTVARPACLQIRT